jgi:hypothetical protein
VKRSIISAAAVAALAFALSACGTGRHSQTASMVAAVPGVSRTAPGAGDPAIAGTVSLRNAALVYPGTEGYKAGSEATALAWLFNDTPVEQRVVVKHQGQEIKQLTIAPGKFQRAELKFRTDKAIGSADTADISFEWVGVNVMELTLPVAPPEAPAPGEKIELPAEPGEGH